MRRGLISWSRAELPEAVLDARVARVQSRMTSAGLDALAIYTTPARAAGAAWLAGFVPYWNQGLLVVPKAGRPAMVSALSNRVHDWIGLNAHVGEVRNHPAIGTAAAEIVSSAATKGRIGVADLNQLPAVLIEQMTAAGHELKDASGVLADARAVADPADIALHARAAAIARQALEAVDPQAGTAAHLIAAAETVARGLGAEEVYPALAADLARSSKLVRIEGDVRLGATFALRLSVAYKGAWVRVTRTYARDAGLAATIERARERFAEAVAQLPDQRGLGAFQGWLIEATRTTMPLEPIAGQRIARSLDVGPGAIVNAAAVIEVNGQPVAIAGPVLTGREGDAAALLGV